MTLRPTVLIAFSLLLTSCASQPPQEATPSSAAKAQYLQAISHFRQGEMMHALEASTRISTEFPKYAPAYELSGIINQQLNRLQEAGDSYQTALELSPNAASVLNNYGNFECARRNYGSAQALFERAANSPSNTQPAIARTNAGLCALRSKDASDAQQQFKAAIELDPTQSNALYQLAQLALIEGRATTASTWLKQYAQHHPHTAKTLLLGAKIEADLGNPIGLSDYRDKLQQGFPSSEEAKQVNALSSTNTVTNNQQTRHADNWVRARNPEHFTLHINSANSRGTLEQLSKNSAISNDAAIYTGASGTHILISGNFASFEQAQQALTRLPETLQQHRPWIRNFAGIQATLTTQ